MLKSIYLGFRKAKVQSVTVVKFGMYDRGGDGVGCLVVKKVPTFKLSVTLSNLNRFSKVLQCWKAHKICYKPNMALPTSP